MRRILACGFAALLLAGCSSMHATQLSAPAPGGPVPTASAAHVRVRLTNGSTVWLRHASADAESLRGVVTFGRAPYHPDQPVAFALSDVRIIESRQWSAGKTIGLVAGVGIVWTAFVILLRSIGPDPGD